ncbi:unnamed protein product [Urochloa humidicola]
MSSSSTRKRRHESTAVPPPEATTTPAAAALPPDLVLEIAARSDAATIVRCAACCKPLRRGILSPAFIRRVCHGPGAAAAVPPRLLGFLQSLHGSALSGDSSPLASFSLAHPATPAAALFSDKHLEPSLPAAAVLLAAGYDPVASRGGLVVLRRRGHHAAADMPREEHSSICVYDPMTGGRAFLADPPEMADFSSYSWYFSYVLLTASDDVGIGGGRSAFLLLAADFTMLSSPASSINVRTFSSDAGEWSPVTTAATHRRAHDSSLHPCCSAVVVDGAVHWAMRGGGGRDQFHILTYNVGTATAGSIKLPIDRLPESYRESPNMGTYDANLRLASSPDGKKLTMFVRDKLRILAWRLQAAGAGWEQHAMIDMETELLSSLMPLPPNLQWQDNVIHFLCSWERCGVVLLEVEGDNEEDLIVLDVETKEMHRVNGHTYMPFIPFEVDLESRLSAMKTF